MSTIIRGITIDGKKWSDCRAEDKLWWWWDNMATMPGSDWTREYQFNTARRWRFDFASPMFKVAIELDGSAPWSPVAHNYLANYHQTPRGQRLDCEKRNEATRTGWKVFVYPSSFAGTQTGCASICEEMTDVIIAISEGK